MVSPYFNNHQKQWNIITKKNVGKVKPFVTANNQAIWYEKKGEIITKYLKQFHYRGNVIEVEIFMFKRISLEQLQNYGSRDYFCFNKK